MSAPSSGSASGSPTAGYYPDPSIPGYIRYWNGSAWVPGTSRPEPREGEELPPPPSAAASAAAPPAPTAAEPAPAEETGPVFLDEVAGQAAGQGASVPQQSTGAPAGQAPAQPDGSAPAWQADANRQAGLPGQGGNRVSWGQDGRPEGQGAPAEEAQQGGRAARDGTFQMRAVSPAALKGEAEGGRSEGGASAVPDHTVGLRRTDLPPRQSGPPAAPQNFQDPQPLPNSGQAPQQPQPGAPGVPGQAQPAPGLPGQQGPGQPGLPAQHQPGPGHPGPQQGVPEQSPGWAQQVHDLAQGPGAGGFPGGQGGPGPEGAVPWRPPVSDPFLEAASRQERPAGLGKRFAARLVDAVITSAVAGAVAFPLVTAGMEHIEQKMRAVELSGETEQVWLIDGTTGGYLAVVLGVLLVFGLLYEVLPTARWGRTLGKKLFGLRVLSVEAQDKPEFVPALLRWLVYGGLSLVVVGVVNAAWCLFDRPWRQCWHDKVAKTFVATDSGGPSPGGLGL
ncbi:RDD family protein [Streptomyces sp. HNM0574]|uniref:RDD family protein n=1 Tax=Streptomyces sp. HNM0574 TaxID=2714954 RepID=UPI00146DFF3B|nr:RDD family protein [Streptomyces sp. HNM0574]NLU66555.1 DUF2510 domain-containing protein [Streptomyces sp. HNM0574]